MKKIAKLLLFIVIGCCLFFINLTNAEETKGIIRVKLTNYKISDSMKLGVWGSYALNSELFFQSGTELDISIENNEFIIKYKGLSIKAGKELFFRRYLSNLKENGLRINGAVHLLEGDLKLSIKDGRIEPIIYIMLEDYLKGVVPYEMNNSFPLEALKAQAIAARTYSIMNLKPNENYDLVDNTNNQVYKGMLTENTSANKAVLETEGRILTYNSKPAHCYYTASNGGLTEKVSNVWKGKDLPYLTIKEDVYDKKNPESTVKYAEFKSDFKKIDEKYPELASLIRDKVQARLKKASYDDQAFDIKSISNLSFMNEKEDLGLGFHKNLYLDVIVNAKKIDEEASKKVKIKLNFSVFDELEPMLDISINIKKNELSELEKSEEGYILSFRRYGHGVGLSQRGAQQMAKEGKNYKQILDFYFPQTKLMLYKTQLKLLDMPYSSFLATPAPKPTATPRPSLMPLSKQGIDSSRIAVVDKINKLETLNLRSKASSNSEIIMQLYYGQELLVIEYVGEDWLKVKTDVVEGYVMKKFVTIVNGTKNNKK